MKQLIAFEVEETVVGQDGMLIVAYDDSQSGTLHDASLVDSAPELLEAIEKLVKLHADWDKGSAYVPVAFYEKNNAAIAEARIAIAKARGAA